MHFSLNDQAVNNFKAHSTIASLNGRDYTVMRPGVLYPGVWGWDAAFYSLGLTWSFDLNRGLDELTVSSLGQCANGMIPHILFYDAEVAREQYYPAPNVWENQSASGLPVSGISQPPVFASALHKIREIAKHKGDSASIDENKERFEQLFQVAMRYHKWWYDERDIDQIGLVATVHPWETGRDNACEWHDALARIKGTRDYIDFPFDPAVRKDIRINRKGQSTVAYRPSNDEYKMFTYLLMKFKDNEYSLKNVDGEYRTDFPFMVYDVTVNAWLQASNLALFALADHYGDKDDKALIRKWIRRTGRSFNLLWNKIDKTYQSYDILIKKVTGVSCNASFMPLLFEQKESRVYTLMETLTEWRSKYHFKYMVPSSLPSHLDYDEDCYWRGPVWTIMNAVIAYGFNASAKRFENPDFATKAQKLANEIIEIIAQDGEFYEYHNPVTGEGCGAPDFGFTSVAYLIAKDIVENPVFGGLDRCIRR